MNTPQTLKGFRDFLPEIAIKRQFAISKIKEVFERFGFDPLETPALEYADILMGKYGDEADKLLYLFEDRGGRKVGLRYDQTVPTSRVVAQYATSLPMPFKRYQIQPVWRAENPQKGRFREFLQCDADIFGTESITADAELIALVYATLKNLGFSTFRIALNDRTIFGSTPPAAITIVDKVKKIGDNGVQKELQEKGFDPTLLNTLRAKTPTDRLTSILSMLSDFNVPKDALEFDPTLARGLDYYTSTIFEVTIEGYDAGSVCGGGRYDNLIESFIGTKIPAIGFAFGFDRLLEAMDQFELLPTSKTNTKAFVTVFSQQQLEKSRKIVSSLRNAGIQSEISLDSSKLEKQFKYADKKGIPYVLVCGPDESMNNVVQLKNMKTKEQKELSLDAIIDILRLTQ